MLECLAVWQPETFLILIQGCTDAATSKHVTDVTAQRDLSATLPRGSPLLALPVFAFREFLLSGDFSFKIISSRSHVKVRVNFLNSLNDVGSSIVKGIKCGVLGGLGGSLDQVVGCRIFHRHFDCV